MRRMLLFVMLVACGGADSGTKATFDSAADTSTPEDVDYAAVRACIAEQWVRQTCTGCHFEGNHLDLRFDALETLKETDRELHPGPIVVPGDPDASLLVRKVEAKVGLLTLEDHEGAPMPPDVDITTDDAQLIREWVADGAPLPNGC